MPSSKLPTSLRAGPGRLPANVVSASALTAPVSANVQRSEFSVVAVASAAALPRLGKHLTVLVTFGTTYTITLPSAPHVGDVVTLVGVGGSGGAVSVRATPGSQLHGSSGLERFAGPPYGARSFVCINEQGGWAASSEKPATVVVSSTQALTRAGTDTIVLADATSGNLALTLPTSSQVGDRFLVVKTAGSANTVTIVRGGSDLIDGRVSTVLVSTQGSVTLLRTSTTPAVAWTTVTESAATTSVVNTTGTQTLPRTSSNMVVLADATSGAQVLTLPALSQVGDRIVVVKTAGDSVTVTRNGSDLIDGRISTALASNQASITLVRTSAASPLAWTTVAESAASTVGLSVSSTQTLLRASANMVIVADSTAGLVTLTLPALAQVGDRITVIKPSSPNSVAVARNNAGESIDGRISVALTNSGSLTLVRSSGSSWTTVTESTAIIEATGSIALASADRTTVSEIFVLVKTSSPTWISGTKTIDLPLGVRVGSKVTIIDLDGAAPANSISVPNSIVGLNAVGAFTGYVLASAYGSVTFVNRDVSEWVVLSETPGLVEDFTQLSRVDAQRGSTGRLRPTPMFNWSERRVALHAEFAGHISNAVPVDGFSGGGTMSLRPGASFQGQIGVMECVTTPTTVGYVHLGNDPTSDVFSASQMLGFRAILKAITANPGVDYTVEVGFGDNIGLASLGNNSLFLRIGAGGQVVACRRSGGGAVATTGALGTVAVFSKYVFEYYFDGTAWNPVFNGVLTAGGSTSIPTGMLNFGMRVTGTGGVAYSMHVDSFTIFTGDLAASRHN